MGESRKSFRLNIAPNKTPTPLTVNGVVSLISQQRCHMKPLSCSCMRSVLYAETSAVRAVATPFIRWDLNELIIVAADNQQMRGTTCGPR